VAEHNGHIAPRYVEASLLKRRPFAVFAVALLGGVIAGRITKKVRD
jgi:hypothetical protein